MFFVLVSAYHPLIKIRAIGILNAVGALITTGGLSSVAWGFNEVLEQSVRGGMGRGWRAVNGGRKVNSR